MTLDDRLQNLSNKVFAHGRATRTNTPFHYGEPESDSKLAILSDLENMINEQYAISIKEELYDPKDKHGEKWYLYNLILKVKEYCK